MLSALVPAIVIILKRSVMLLFEFKIVYFNINLKDPNKYIKKNPTVFKYLLFLSSRKTKQVLTYKLQVI